MYIVTVLPTQRGARTDALTYFAREKLSLGSLVSAPLRNKSIFAIVISLEEATDIKSSLKDAPFALKKITSVVSENALPKPVLAAINDVALFYATRVSTVLDITIPRILFTEENKKAFFNWQPYKIQDRTEDNLILGAPLEERIAW